MIVNLILILLVILILIAFYILYRNNKVYYFTVGLCDFLLDELKRILNTYKDDDEFFKDKNNYYAIKEKVQFLLEKNSYNKYLYSFKSLKLENYFSEEDLEFIKYLKQYRK